MLIGVFRTTGFRNCFVGHRHRGLSGRQVALGVHQSRWLGDSKAFRVGRRHCRRFHDSSTCGLEGVAIACSPYERGRNCWMVRGAWGLGWMSSSFQSRFRRRNIFFERHWNKKVKAKSKEKSNINITMLSGLSMGKVEKPKYKQHT